MADLVVRTVGDESLVLDREAGTVRHLDAALTAQLSRRGLLGGAALAAAVVGVTSVPLPAAAATVSGSAPPQPFSRPLYVVADPPQNRSSVRAVSSGPVLYAVQSDGSATEIAQFDRPLTGLAYDSSNGQLFGCDDMEIYAVSAAGVTSSVVSQPGIRGFGAAQGQAFALLSDSSYLRWFTDAGATVNTTTTYVKDAVGSDLALTDDAGVVYVASVNGDGTADLTSLPKNGGTYEFAQNASPPRVDVGQFAVDGPSVALMWVDGGLYGSSGTSFFSLDTATAATTFIATLPFQVTTGG